MNSAITIAKSSLFPIKLKFALDPSANPNPPNKIDFPAPKKEIEIFLCHLLSYSKFELYNSVKNLVDDPSSGILEIDKLVQNEISPKTFPTNNFEVPLASSLIPWIDAKLDNGQSKEEWKAFAETNKILGNEERPIPIDGTCVRIGSMRSHSAALTIKLRKNISINEIENIIKQTSEWTQIVKNEKISTIKELSPASVSGTLKVPVGRIRKLNIGKDYLNVFTVGDQLLWGAAEPLRRMLKIVLYH